MSEREENDCTLSLAVQAENHAKHNVEEVLRMVQIGKLPREHLTVALELIQKSQLAGASNWIDGAQMLFDHKTAVGLRLAEAQMYLRKAIVLKLAPDQEVPANDKRRNSIEEAGLVASLPKNATFVIVWFSSTMDEKEEKVGDLRQNFEQDTRLVGETRAKLLSYRYACRVAVPALGEWLRRKVVKKLLGSAVEWLNRKIN